MATSGALLVPFIPPYCGCVSGKAAAVVVLAKKVPRQRLLIDKCEREGTLLGWGPALGWRQGTSHHPFLALWS